MTRPRQYDPTWAAALAAALRGGRSLRELLRTDERFPSTATFYRLRRQHPELAATVARALAGQRAESEPRPAAPEPPRQRRLQQRAVADAYGDDAALLDSLGRRPDAASTRFAAALRESAPALAAVQREAANRDLTPALAETGRVLLAGLSGGSTPEARELLRLARRSDRDALTATLRRYCELALAGADARPVELLRRAAEPRPAEPESKPEPVAAEPSFRRRRQQAGQPSAPTVAPNEPERAPPRHARRRQRWAAS